MQQSLQGSIEKANFDVKKDISKIIEDKITALKQELVKEICGELKGKVLKTWQEGTDRFYNDAKSMISDLSRPQSVVSDYSRSRSVSRDFTLKPSNTMRSSKMTDDDFPENEEQSFKPSNSQMA